MKRFYVMIEAGKQFSRDCHLYKFRVGTSQRDVKAYQVVRQFADERGYYLSQWSRSDADFIKKLAHSVGCDFLQLNWLYMDVNELAKCIRQHGTTPKKSHLSRNEVLTLRIFGLLIPK